MEVLVTGGAGFIGSNYVHHLVDERGADVTVLDKLTYAGSLANLEGVRDEVRFVEGDVRDRGVVDGLVEGADVVVNFAAETHVDRSIRDGAGFVRSNVEGVAVLLEAARRHGVERYVQIGTDEVYGSIEEGRFSERDRLNPRNPYSASKAGADHLALSYHATHGLPVVVTRSSNNYGPRQHTEKFVPTIITNALRGDAIPVYGDGSNVRDWLYVRDNCRAVDVVRREGVAGEVYNVGAGNELSNLELVETVLDVMGVEDDLVEFVEDRKGHDQRYALDSSKIEGLGWRPGVGLREGLRRTVDYYSGRLA